MSPLFVSLIAILCLALMASIAVAAYLFGSRKPGASTESSAPSPVDSLTRFYITLSNDAVLITNPQGVVLNYNEHFVALLGAQTSLENQNISDVLKASSADGKPVTARQIIGALKNTDSAIEESIFMLDSLNNRINVTIAIFKVHTASGSLLVWRLTNLTQQQHIADQQREFISVISHELRTPVTVIEASTSSLLTEAGDASAAELKLIQATRENALLLSKLIADLSVFSSIQSGVIKPQMTSVSPRIIVDQMQKAFSAQADEKNIALVVDHDQNVRNIISGESHLLSILQNFIKNALQFSEPGGVVIIGTKAAPDGVIFMVRDTGKGMSNEEQQRVFENTFHADVDTQHQTLQGVGVGLYISSQLAKSIGAKVWVESQPNKGSSFYIKVPVSYATEESKRTVHTLEVNQFAQDI